MQRNSNAPAGLVVPIPYNHEQRMMNSLVDLIKKYVKEEHLLRMVAELYEICSQTPSFKDFSQILYSKTPSNLQHVMTMLIKQVTDSNLAGMHPSRGHYDDGMVLHSEMGYAQFLDTFVGET